ncbi:uncharacterized protein [Euwallacea fornicatus]|uniref:uncharacterized protein n=1 Tax=Euwallacea fornicatus TaxID=995702 RepID=UPI00338FCD61
MANPTILLCILSAVLTGKAMCGKYLLVDKVRLDFMKLEGKLWKYVLRDTPGRNKIDAQYQVIKRFREFEETMKMLPSDNLRGTEPIRNIHAYIFLFSDIKQTENLYQKFRRAQEDRIKLYDSNFSDEKLVDEAVNLDDIIKDILNTKTGANVTVHKIYDLTFGSENMAKEILDLLMKEYPCQTYNQSPQQIYYNLYNAIALNGLKCYMMIQFAYLNNRILQPGNYTELSQITKKNFERRVNETTSVFKGIMEIVPSEFWQCDPKKHVKGKTYDEFTRLLQGHIQNEVDMSSGGTCRETCAAYPSGTSYGCYDSESKYCRETERCNGRLLKCQFIESHMNICPSETGSRRYDYIEYQSGRTFGKKSNCWKKPIDSWWRWFVRCSYCFCICDEQGSKSDRYINLKPVMADIENNRVVTGLKFVKENRIMHLQIQEGKLLPYGYIDNNTVRWVPVEEYKITNDGVYNMKDYFTMTYENRQMAMDDIELSENDLVMTGVRFQFIDNQIRLQIHANKFDFESGKILVTEGNYSYNAAGGKNKIEIYKADIPINSPPSEMDYFTEDPYVEFTHTDMDLDAAQTTVPFVDITPLTNYPQVPLRGAGVYYRGKGGYGGFIAPKLITYDYSKLILVQFPEEEIGQKDATKSSLEIDISK